MAEFKVEVCQIEVHPHFNADALEVASVGEFKCVVGKGQFKSGDFAVYIPENAVVSDFVLEQLGLTGKLAGKKRNRVKATKLRGVLSQGLLYPVIQHPNTDRMHIVTGHNEIAIVRPGDDVADILGITKYQPPIPVHMAGNVWNALGKTLKYDIENFKRYPDVLVEGEEVVFTEKVHGSWTGIGYFAQTDEIIVSSKGLSAKGLALKLNGENVNNLYVRILNELRFNGKDLIQCGKEAFGDGQAFYFLGETFGQGVQDLTYGATVPSFRVFDVYVGEPANGRYLDYDEIIDVCSKFGIPTVPELFRGPFSIDEMEKHTSGTETVSGKGVNIREGIVIKPVKERTDEQLGRVILKNVSEQYLLRKGGTEYN